MSKKQMLARTNINNLLFFFGGANRNKYYDPDLAPYYSLNLSSKSYTVCTIIRQVIFLRMVCIIKQL